MNIRWFVAAALLMLSGSPHAADIDALQTSYPLGVWLITIGMAFLITEAALPNYGVIGLGGLLMLIFGAITLNNAEMPGPLMVGLGFASTLLLVFLVIRALRTRPRQTVCGDAGLLGSVTPITRLQAGDTCGGWVHLQGESWRVSSATPLQPGQRVQVVARRGLLLQVAAADEAPRGE